MSSESLFEWTNGNSRSTNRGKRSRNKRKSRMSSQGLIR